VHEYFYVPEVVRLALVAGVVVSMLFYERVQLTTGGAIVPAYLALFVPAPLFVAVTLLFGYLTYLVVSVVLARKTILYGRRKFEVEVLVGLVFVTVGNVAAHLLSRADVRYLGLAGIGFLVPGVIAHDMFRQRPARTVLAVVATTTIVAVFVYVVSSLLAIAPLEPTPRPALAETPTGYPISLLLLGVMVSVAAGMLLFTRLGLRSGGFVTPAYLALAVPRPLDLVFAAAVAVLTWLVVTKVLMPRVLIFGRRKLSTMILIGSIIAWTAELAVVGLTGYLPWRGLTLMTLVVPALLANDAQRQGLVRTAWGAALGTAAVFGVVTVVAAGLQALGVSWV
jgi:poly-gamma-glutamate biosynthesis protein PgsC/CapC